MVDMGTILQSFSQRRVAVAATAKVNKQTIFEALAASGFTRINVTFDGAGDSGQIDNLAGFVGDVLTKIPELKLTVQEASWSDSQIATKERTLPAAIEHLCYEFLEQQHGGWENNDGAFGKFTLDVVAKTVELEFNGRYSDVHTSTHTF
jgi:hypothetical protein